MEQTFACAKTPDATVPTPPPHFVQVYWRLFWSGQQFTRIHLFRDYPERGYLNPSPEEGRTLCGEHIPTYYVETDRAAVPTICKRCQKKADLLAAEAAKPALLNDGSTCQKCGRSRKHLTNTGTTEFPFWQCGTCIHREERRVNTKEMHGRGRRGY